MQFIINNNVWCTFKTRKKACNATEVSRYISYIGDARKTIIIFYVFLKFETDRKLPASNEAPFLTLELSQSSGYTIEQL